MSKALALLLRAKMRPDLLEDRVFADTLDSAFVVHRALGPCHDKITYQNALALEAKSRGHDLQKHATFSVLYRQKVVGTYEADLVVAESVLVQVVSEGALDQQARSKLLRGLASGNVKTGIVIHFGGDELAFARLL